MRNGGRGMGYKGTIAAGRRHSIGLKSDGTVKAVGDNKHLIMKVISRS
jgi:hypothetical protein